MKPRVILPEPSSHKMKPHEAVTVKLVGPTDPPTGNANKMVKLDGYWKVRVDVVNASEQQILKLFGGEGVDIDVYDSVWYIHPQGKIHGRHLHGLISGCQRSDEWYRQRIKAWQTKHGITHENAFALSNTYAKGTKMSKENLMGYVTYMAKGKHEVAYASGHGFKDLTARHWDDWVHHETPKATVKDSSDGNHRITTHELAAHAYGMYMDNLITPEEVLESTHALNKDKLTECVLRTLKHHRKGRNVNLVANVIQTVLADISPTHYNALLNRRIGW